MINLSIFHIYGTVWKTIDLSDFSFLFYVPVAGTIDFML